MNAFIWTVVIMFGLEGLLKLAALVKGQLYTQHAAGHATRITVLIALIVWGAVLLARQS